MARRTVKKEPEATPDVVALARVYAMAAHSAVDHRRKYTGDRYHVHPAAVARLLAGYGFGPHVVAAAHLHDVLEDTHATVADLSEVFPSEVVALVVQVTDVSRPEDGNRAARKALDLAHLIRATPEGRAIKLADMIDNTASIVAHDPKFARVYLPEKRLVLRAFKGTPGLDTLHMVATNSLQLAWRKTFEKDPDGWR